MKQLATKLVNVQKGIKTVSKDGHNDFHNYDYATEAGFLSVLRPLLIQEGLVILSSVKDSSVVQQVTDKSGKASPLTRVQMEFTILDSETGESFTAGAEGYGQDALDKGIYKAITGATKYFLAKCFLIPTGDDPENDGGTKKPRAKVKEATQFVNATKYICQVCGKEYVPKAGTETFSTKCPKCFIASKAKKTVSDEVPPPPDQP